MMAKEARLMIERVQRCSVCEAPACAGVHVLDDFLDDPDLVTAMHELHVKLLPNPVRGAAVWSFGDSDLTPSPPRAVKLFVGHALSSAWRGVSPRAVEYWSNIMCPGDQLRVHFDKDEVLYQATGEVVTPLFSTVYYLDADGVVGGELELQGRTISPRSNRAVVFSGHLQHRVRPILDGVRRSFVFNGWAHRPMAPMNRGREVSGGA
jgi:hypothetical protein